VGLSGTGKSFLAKSLARHAEKAGRPVVIFDPMFRSGSQRNARGWSGLVIGRDQFERFYGILTASRGLMFIVDEIGVCNEMGFRRQLDELFVTARNDGHVGVMIAQRYRSQMSVTARTQCRDVRVFTAAPDDGDALSNDFNCPALTEPNRIPPGVYVAAQAVGHVSVHRLGIPGKTWPAVTLPPALAALARESVHFRRKKTATKKT
jgi:hypothetical protein